MLHKGEPEGGTILVLLTDRGENPRVYERMPSLDGDRKWTLSKVQDPDNKREIDEYLERRGAQDRDLWIIELDIADGERLIGLTDAAG
mgnify:FL=1